MTKKGETGITCIRGRLSREALDSSSNFGFLGAMHQNQDLPQLAKGD